MKKKNNCLLRYLGQNINSASQLPSQNRKNFTISKNSYGIEKVLSNTGMDLQFLNHQNSLQIQHTSTNSTTYYLLSLLDCCTIEGSPILFR